MVDWNRKLETYPLAFFVIVKEGEGMLDPEALGWTLNSTKLRFRAFINALRALTMHDLHKSAARRKWCYTDTDSGKVLVEGKLFPDGEGVVNRVSVRGYAKQMKVYYPEYP